MTKILVDLMNKEQLKKLAITWAEKANKLYDKPYDNEGLSYAYADALEKCGIELLCKIGERKYVEDNF